MGLPAYRCPRPGNKSPRAAAANGEGRRMTGAGSITARSIAVGRKSAAGTPDAHPHRGRRSPTEQEARTTATDEDREPEPGHGHAPRAACRGDRRAARPLEGREVGTGSRSRAGCDAGARPRNVPHTPTVAAQGSCAPSGVLAAARLTRESRRLGRRCGGLYLTNVTFTNHRREYLLSPGERRRRIT
jgi:hypothetical protein